MIAAEFGTGQVLWSVLWIFLFVIWFWLTITVFTDLMRSDTSGWSKALWTIAILILPFLGVFLYLIVNGNRMDQRAQADAEAADQAARAYIQDVAGTGASAADQLDTLARLHDAGKLDDAEFAAAKAKIVGSS